MKIPWPQRVGLIKTRSHTIPTHPGWHTINSCIHKEADTTQTHARHGRQPHSNGAPNGKVEILIVGHLLHVCVQNRSVSSGPYSTTLWNTHMHTHVQTPSHHSSRMYTSTYTLSSPSCFLPGKHSPRHTIHSKPGRRREVPGIIAPLLTHK